jgi:hypothetical protein
MKRASESQHAKVGSLLVALAASHAEREDWAAAAELGRRAMPILTGHGQEYSTTELDENGEAATNVKPENREDEDAASSASDSTLLADRTNAFRLYARVLYQLAPDDKRARRSFRGGTVGGADGGRRRPGANVFAFC